VQYVTNITVTNWTDVAGDVLATDITASKTVGIGAFNRQFYRVELLP
jgi:hypothetical protein